MSSIYIVCTNLVVLFKVIKNEIRDFPVVKIKSYTLDSIWIPSKLLNIPLLLASWIYSPA